jgi:hypothetical protein
MVTDMKRGELVCGEEMRVAVILTVRGALRFSSCSLAIFYDMSVGSSLHLPSPLHLRHLSENHWGNRMDNHSGRKVPFSSRNSKSGLGAVLPQGQKFP